jgi:hypothetical protein
MGLSLPLWDKSTPKGHILLPGMKLYACLRFCPGTDVMISKIFSVKNSAKISAFFIQTPARFSKNLIITLVFEKNANFSQKIGKNWQKL